MALTPMDIAEQRFRCKFRGYDPREVHLFLEKVAEEYRQIKQMLHNNQVQMGKLQQELTNADDREQSLRTMMITAQKAIDEQKLQADKTAAEICRQATGQASALVAEAEVQTHHLLEQAAQLRSQRDRFIEEMRGLIHSHDRLLDLYTQQHELLAPTTRHSGDCPHPALAPLAAVKTAVLRTTAGES